MLMIVTLASGFITMLFACFFLCVCRNPPFIHNLLVATLFLHLCTRMHGLPSFLFSSGISLLVSAASPSSFGHVIASGPPVPKASPAVLLFQVFLSCCNHGSSLQRSRSSINCTCTCDSVANVTPQIRKKESLQERQSYLIILTA